MIREKAIIITFHCCPNYGAVLQTYGLYQYLKSIFQEVEVLDYRPSSLMNEYKYINTYSLGSIVVSIWSLFPFLKKRMRFSAFLRHINMSRNTILCVNDIKQIDAKYCFVGSDQIWNPEITHGFDKVYFGGIPHSDPFFIISYGASLGKGMFSQEEKIQLKQLLQGISAMSVRESSAKDMIEKDFKINADVVLDPTLLAGRFVFDKFVINKQKEEYLFIYTLSQNPNEVVRPLAQQIANEKRLRIIEISGNRKGFNKVTHKVIYDAGPVEFLSILANAKYVVTDSFHGTAFSLLFHRQFLTIPHRTRGGRMISLLSIVGLEHRLAALDNVHQMDMPIDWTDVDKRLDSARKRSAEFIMKSIK